MTFQALMDSSGDNDYLDLVQTTRSGPEVQQLISNLIDHVNTEPIVEKDGWSRMNCSSMPLDMVKEAFMKEFLRSKKITDIVRAIISPPADKLYISREVQLLVFQTGRSNLEELVGKDDCIVLISVAIIGSANATIEERETRRRATCTFTTNSELVITGRCSLWIPPESKIVCVVLCIAKDKG